MRYRQPGFKKDNTEEVATVYTKINMLKFMKDAKPHLFSQ